MTIGGFSVKNGVLLNILMVVFLVAGYFSVTRLPQEQFSEIPFYFVNIIVPYPGVAAEDIEQSVTVPVENEMAGMNRLREIRSVTSEGLSRVTLQFDQGINDEQFARLFQEVQNRFNRLQLPEGTLQAIVDDFSTNDFLPVIEVVLSGEVPYAQLNRAARTLSDRLRTIPEVSGVNLIGSRDRQIKVELQRERMEALGISFNEAVAAIRGRNVTIPGGTLLTNSREFLIRTVGQLGSAAEFPGIIVRRSADGRGGIVRLGDIATITEGYDLSGTASRFNGRQAISMQVTKIPGGSSIGIIDEVRRRVDGFESALPAGVTIDYLNDSTVQIRDSINVLVSNAIFGLVLLVVILLLFVGFRNALMTAIGIPLTFALTFVVLELLGETINGNTLFGLVLVLGLIVDHAIVIVENSYRLRQEGLSRHEAAIKGVNQVVIPVIAATATTVAAFLPLTFLPGIIGKFLRVVPLTVSIALIASTFEAAVFLPSHFADWPGGNKPPREPWIFNRVQAQFRRILTLLYRWRITVSLVSVALLIGVISLVTRIPQDLFSAEDFTLFYVDIEMPPGTPVTRTDQVVRRYEERLLPLIGNGEIVAVNSFVGFSGSSSENVRRPNVAQLVVDLTEQDEGRTRPISVIMAEAQELTRDIPGPDRVQFRKQQSGPPTDPPLSLRLFGDSFAELEAVSLALQDRLAQYPELFNLKDNLDAGTPELRIVVDEDRAAEFGLSSQSIGLFIRGTFDGVTAGTIFTDNEETAITVRYQNGGPISASSFLQLKVPTPDGRLIPFSAVASLRSGDAISSVRRVEGKREVTITADAYNERNIPNINAAMRTLFDQELAARYPGVTLRVGGEFAEIANTLRDILRVFVIGVFLIYTILAAQFKSYTQPILIMFAVPFAFVGVVLFLLSSGTPLSTIVIYATVALAGVAVNDAIVLISFANEKRAEGVSVAEAVIEAAVTRLRPILLTSLTTIAGLLPTALGVGGVSVVWGPMASTIIFGLAFSTITTLVIVPSYYGVFYDRERRDQRRRARAERRLLVAGVQ